MNTHRLPSNKNLWFISDLHLGHRNILKYERPHFSSLEEMHNSYAIEFKQKLDSNSIVYHLGDLALSSHSFVEEWLTKNLSTKRFYNIYGNHDSSRLQKIVTHCYDTLMLRVTEDDTGTIQKVWLAHYAHKVWPGSGSGSWHLYGHSHGNLADDSHALSMDVGVDTGQILYSYEDVKAHMTKKEWKQVDHHGKDTKDQ